MGLGPNPLAMLGGVRAVSDAVAEPLGVELVPLSVAEMKSLTLVCAPAVVALMLTLAVHDPLAGIVAPVA